MTPFQHSDTLQSPLVGYECAEKFVTNNMHVWGLHAVFTRVSAKSLIKAPSTCIRFWLKTDIFFARFGLSCSRIRLKRAPKTHLFKTVSRIEIFKTSVFRLRVDGGFRIRWWHTSYTSRMTHAQSGILSFFHRFSVFAHTEEKDSNTLRVHAYFLKTEKKISVFKNTLIRVDGA